MAPVQNPLIGPGLSGIPPARYPYILRGELEQTRLGGLLPTVGKVARFTYHTDPEEIRRVAEENHEGGEG